MTQDELLAKLRGIETRLYSAEVASFFDQQDLATRDQLQFLRAQVSQQVAQLASAHLEDFLNNTKQFSPDLAAGVNELQAELDRLDRPSIIISAVSSMVALVGRVTSERGSRTERKGSDRMPTFPEVAPEPRDRNWKRAKPPIRPDVDPLVGSGEQSADSETKSGTPVEARERNWKRAKPPLYPDVRPEIAPSLAETTTESKRNGGDTATKAAPYYYVPERPSNVVNLGFVPASKEAVPLTSNQSLTSNTDYYLWLKVGDAMAESIGQGDTLPVENLPNEATIKVALFSFDNELEITPGQDVGELKIQPDGTVKVNRQASLPPDARADILLNFLFFPVRTPERTGPHRLRCNFYCGQILVQSHLITAQVAPAPLEVEGALMSIVDYTLSQTLNSENLVALAEQPHRLSLMLNSSPDGSYNMRFFGGDDAQGEEMVKDEAPIDADEIKGFLDWARSAMHKVAWDHEEEWDPDTNWAYRYDTAGFDAPKLAKDLAYLARAGGRVYSGILDNLKLDGSKLETLMSKSGLVQIALKLSPPAVLPAAIIYDYAWDPDAFEDFDNTPFTLCETFQAGIEAATKGLAPLEECACFKDACSLKKQIKEIQADPNRTLRDLPPIICPSGFWGYRHALGFPLTLAKDFNTNPVITYEDQLQMVAGVSTDPQLIERDQHLDRLKVLKEPFALDRDESYVGIVKRLKAKKPHLIYFYCHGGVRQNKLPYLEVGVKDRFSPQTLNNEGVRWDDNPRPLVFINGCKTTALNPEIALNFVTPLVQLCGASGVIGTEITIFEPLAVAFAEECLKRFLGVAPHNEGMPIGTAVRGARLELLRRGNPLGLVYIPFVIASLRLLKQANNN